MTRFAFPGNSRQSGAGLFTEPGAALSSCSRRGPYIEAAVPTESSRLTLECKHSNWFNNRIFVRIITGKGKEVARGGRGLQS